jgi:hypothetical protein
VEGRTVPHGGEDIAVSPDGGCGNRGGELWGRRRPTSLAIEGGRRERGGGATVDHGRICGECGWVVC